MTQINRGRKDTLPHLVFWSAKNTHWWGNPVVRSLKLVWTDVWRLHIPMTFPANPKYFLLFMSSYVLPLLSSGSPISSPSLMHPLSPGVSSRVGFRSCRWENEIISSSISSSSSPTAANSCSSWCFFLKPQVQELCDYAGISSSIANKMSLATENLAQQKTNTNNDPPLDVGKRLLRFLNAWTWQYGPSPGSSYTRRHQCQVWLTTCSHPAGAPSHCGGRKESVQLHFCLSCSGQERPCMGQRHKKRKMKAVTALNPLCPQCCRNTRVQVVSLFSKTTCINRTLWK